MTLGLIFNHLFFLELVPLLPNETLGNSYTLSRLFQKQNKSEVYNTCLPPLLGPVRPWTIVTDSTGCPAHI